MDDALQTYLKPEAMELLTQLAKENRTAEAYFITLQACALALKHAECLGSAATSPADQIEQVALETAQAIDALLPGGIDAVTSIIQERLTAYVDYPYLERRQRITERRKTSLLRRLAPHIPPRIPWIRPR